ncbi:MAG: hypothetical protein F4X57_00305 [Chloroflexi bacterium]|nr:hypothetical protein [Chloroflexota bacterium]
MSGARFYAFTLTEDATVTVTLTSKDDTYLYLLSGADRDSDALAENDNNDGWQAARSEGQEEALWAQGARSQRADTVVDYCGEGVGGAGAGE